MNDSTNRSAVQPERRRAPRVALRLNATIREPGRSRVGVRIIDMSMGGCRIETPSGASPDSWVLLCITGLATQYSRVVWQCNEFAGLEFATPLAEVVLDQLLEDQQYSETSISDLRDIAERTHRLATRSPQGDFDALDSLSRKCAVDAVVEGLRLSEDASADSASPGRAPAR